jgi:methyl-accepting chemotaxis protein
MRIRVKLFLGLGVVLVLSAISGLVAWNALSAYSVGVERAEQAKLLSVDVESAAADVDLFLETKDVQTGSRLQSEMTQLRDRIPGSFTGVDDRLATFQSALSSAVDSVGRVDAARQDMGLALEAVSSAIADVNQAANERAEKARTVQTNSNASFATTANISQTLAGLLEVMMNVRIEEERYIHTKDPAGQKKVTRLTERAVEATQALAGHTAGTEHEKAGGKLVELATSYRDQFNGLFEVDEAGFEEAAKKLSRAGRQVGSQARGLNRKQGGTVAIASGFLSEASAEAVRAATITRLGAEMQVAQRNLRLAETAYSDRPAADTAEAARAALASAQGLVTELSEAAGDDRTSQELIERIGAELSRYATSLDAVFAAFAAQQAAGEEIRNAAAEATAAIGAIETEFRSAATQSRDTNLTLVAAGAVLSVVLGLLISVILSRSISRPLHQMTAVMGEITRDNLNVDVPAIGQPGVMGEMAEAVQVFKDHAQQVADLKAEEVRRAAEAEEEKRRAMAELADGFEQSVGVAVAAVRSAAGDISGSVADMERLAGETGGQSRTAADTTRRAYESAASVAAATEELSVSIAEVSQHVATSSDIASQAEAEADRMADKVTELSKAGEEISAVIEVINSIAGQTNMLALNATIEAARAGEMGKGFAVVAQEVKNLAQQTAQATGSISETVGAIQTATRDSVAAINTIRGTVSEINELTTSIVAAVEEQASATREIAESAQDASQSASSVGENVDVVGRAAEETEQATRAIAGSVQQLGGRADEMTQQIETFLATVRQG